MAEVQETTSQPAEGVRIKRKLDLDIADRRKGLTSLELAEHCPDSRFVFPQRPCTNVGCEYAIKQPSYMNCTFVAAECGEHTLEAIGEMMGLTREGVRVIEMRALRKVRRRLSELDETNDAASSLHESSVASGAGDFDTRDEVAEPTDEGYIVSAVHG